MSLPRRCPAVLLAALVLAGCGTTVPSASRTAGSEVGLGGAAVPVVDGAGSTPGTTDAPAGGSAPTTRQPTGSRATGTSSGPVVSGQPPVDVPATTSAGPASKVLKPISLGIVLTGTSNADSFGVSLGNTYSEKQFDEALISALNAKGGLAGRKVVPVYASTDTGSNNWETDFSAACATFTQDNHVAAVLGYVFNYFASFESCLARKGIPHLNTGFNIPDSGELKAFPLSVALDVPTIDRRSLLKLAGGVADGVLTSKSRIGVVIDTCPGTERSLNRVFLPEAKRLGLNVVKTNTINCPNGNSDSGGAVSALQGAVLQFASAQVDQVVFPATSEGPALLLFSLSAESQGYHPKYLVSSLANLDSLKSYFPVAQAKNINGYGWMPTQDVPPSTYAPANAEQKRCLSLLKTTSITPTAGADFYYAYNFCESLFVYEQALLKTNGSSSAQAVLPAIKGLGTSFASLTNAGGSLFAPSLQDAPRSARHVVFVPSCTCFAYTGPSRAIPAG